MSYSNKVDYFIDTLPEEQQKLVQLIRKLIHQVVPNVEERLSFKIPFYHYYGMFCYINPVKQGIDIGFCRGKDLLETFPQLQLKERAIIATLNIQHTNDIVTLEVHSLLTTAALWNEEAKRLKIPMVKKRQKS